MKSEMQLDEVPRQILVEVAYATPAKQVILLTEVAENATIEEAIIASHILDEYSEIDLKINKIGVFSKLTKLDKPVQHKDRIEIYRKLIADPKAVRKERAAAGKAMKKGS